MPISDFPARERLSLCMIVRDEERKLARCLRSAAPWVGELVVVDTGSRDNSVAIAESFGARVVHFPWCNDFAAARNAALDAATRDWVLVLDADEEFEPDPAELAVALEQNDFDGFSLRCHNLLDSGETSYANIFRIFRRSLPGMRYRGALHEQVIAVAERRARTAMLANSFIRHDGYTREATREKNKLERNLAIARAQVEARPQDPFVWYALGLSEIDDGAAIAAYEQGLARLADAPQDAGEPYVAALHHLLALAYTRRGRAEKAREVLEQGISRFPNAPDLRYQRGQWRLDAEDFAGACEDFTACLSPQAASFALVGHPGIVSYAARTGLAMASLQLGRNEEAEALLREALAEAPENYAPTRRMLGSLLLQRGDWAAAQPLLQSAHAQQPEDAALRFQLGWCLYKLERYEEAEEVLLPLAERPDVEHLLGKVYLEWGKGEQALSLLERCALPPALLARGWARYVSGKPREAALCWEEWMRAGAADWGTKDTLAMFMFLLQGGRRPGGQPERPAEPLRDMDQWFRLLLRYQRFDDVEQVIQRGPQLGDRLWLPLRKKWAVTLAKEAFYDVALMLLLEALKQGGDDAELYYWLGYCSLHKQQIADARIMWETCLKLDPRHPLAASGLSLLKQDSPLL